MDDRARPPLRLTAFRGPRLLASGAPRDVAEAARAELGRPGHDGIVVFDDATGRRVDLDLGGSLEDVLARADQLERPAPGAAPRTPDARRPGRPKLGVVAKEVTLLPRHWAWLKTQRGGASATLRRLVDDARRRHEVRDQVRAAQDAAYRFMNATVGDEPGFEEALRALYAGSVDRFHAESERWPADLRTCARRLAAPAFAAPRRAEDESAPPGDAS